MAQDYRAASRGSQAMDGRTAPIRQHELVGHATKPTGRDTRSREAPA